MAISWYSFRENVYFLWMIFCGWFRLYACCSVSQSCPTLWPHGLQHCQASLSFTISWSLLELRSFQLVMSSNHLAPFPPAFSLSSIRVVSTLHIRWPKCIVASASASVLPVNIQGWFPLGLTDFISMQSKGLSRVFSNTTILCCSAFSILKYLQNRKRLIPIEKKPIVTSGERVEEESVRSFGLTEVH